MKPGAFHDASREGVELGEADFVVVGSGAGGGAAARALAQAGFSVAVLEEGPLVRASETSPLLRESMARLFRLNGRTAALGRPPIPYLQGCCVGGTTFVNSAIVWRLPEKVLARWQADFGLAEGFSLREMEPAYAALEEELHVRPVQDAVATRSDLLMREGAARAGIESRPVHRYERGCKGSGRCIHGCPNDAKQSTAINSLRRAVEDGAHVFARAPVRRIEIRGGRATAAVGKGFRVHARRAVIVAASAVQSPSLLRKSGIRGAHLGEHFMAHPGTSVSGIYPDRVDMWNGASQGYEAYGLRDSLGIKFETINVPPEIAAARLPGAGQRFARQLEKLDRLASWAVALRADAEGSVRPSRLFGDVVRYSLTRSDLERLRKGVRACAEMHFFAGATEVMPGVHGLPESITRDQLGLFDSAPLDASAYSLLATHLFGGCRAGKDPRGSVVDPHLRVHGVRDLYVMDASVFPSNTGVNPQHSIMAVALAAARRLAGA
jgi:choline dehydrogenase-like flavoprotein